MEVRASTVSPDREPQWSLAVGSAGWAQWGAPRVPELCLGWGPTCACCVQGKALCTPNLLASLPQPCLVLVIVLPAPAPQGHEEGHSIGQVLGPGCELSHLPHSVARSSLIPSLLVYKGGNTSPYGTAGGWEGGGGQRGEV